MRRSLFPPSAGARLLPEGRLAGPMPWIVAIMIFLTVLATAAAIALGQGAASLGEAVANRLTVQLVEADAVRRDADAVRIAARIAALPGVQRVEPVARAAIAAQLEPWLGADLGGRDIPVPALIDVDLAVRGAQAQALARRIAAEAKGVNPRARMEAHATYLGPVAALVRTIGWIALAVVLLMAVATGCVVMLAARGAHAAHRGTIDIMHLLGATDVQVMRLFQRRMTLDVGFGALLGLIAGLAAILLVGRSMGFIGSDMVGSISLPPWGWVLLPVVPLLFVILAWLAARITFLRALGRAL